jgi:flagellar biosynthesis/type III secretory pathway protein FliH
VITTASMIEARGYAEGYAEGRAEARAEFVLQLIARRWGTPSDQTRETIKGGADREFRAWIAAIVKEESLDAFLAAPDSPAYAGQ